MWDGIIKLLCWLIYLTPRTEEEKKQHSKEGRKADHTTAQKEPSKALYGESHQSRTSCRRGCECVCCKQWNIELVFPFSDMLIR